MSYLVIPPRQVDVDIDADGIPVHLEGGPLRGRVRPLQRWLVDADWWSSPVSREYWRVLLRRAESPARHLGKRTPPRQDELVCEIYRDLESGVWFVERIYD
jgi:hypothetical protein